MSWYTSRLAKAKTPKGGFRIKALHCLSRWGKTGCRHLNDWTAGQETLWSAEEMVRKRKKDEGGNLGGRQTKRENSAISRQGGSVKSTGYPLHSPASPSLPLRCVTVCHHISTGLYQCQWFATPALLKFVLLFAMGLDMYLSRKVKFER
jgi:hypothetical protein